MTTWNGQWHPFAERFPMLPEDELREMAESIKTIGLVHPCVMGPDGIGRDGRNRVAACALAGVEPTWIVHNGDPVAFIVGVNADRRHLSTGQRAMAVAIGLVEAGKREGGRFKRGSVPANSGSGISNWKLRVSEAGVVLDYARELADRVLLGGLALDNAYGTADARRKARERIDALGGDLAALVDGGVITVEEAERRADEAARLTRLADDLAKRVRVGNLSLSEAETIAAERRERIAVWAEKVRTALRTLSGMAGYPVPDELAEHLTPTERAVLALALGAIPQGGLDG